MGRFHGKVGYATSVEKAEGVWEDDIIERIYFGDVIRNTVRFREGQAVNNDLSVGNSIAIIADDFAGGHIHAIRYVEWAGARWTVTEVEVQRPRLILRLGGVYNGVTP